MAVGGAGFGEEDGAVAFTLQTDDLADAQVAVAGDAAEFELGRPGWEVAV